MAGHKCVLMAVGPGTFAPVLAYILRLEVTAWKDADKAEGP